MPKFMKRGKEAKKALKQDQARKESQGAGFSGKTFRFYLKEDKDAVLTFLDGKLAEDGSLDVPMYYEHQVRIDGKWNNWFPCTRDDEPCPLCESKDNPSLVGLLSVIDHRKRKDSKGKKHKDEVRLFVAKSHTMKQLQKIAAKRGGLAGCKFEVTRTGDRSPNVGNMFEFEEKTELKKVLKKYNVTGPLDYVKEAGYHSAKKLRNLGFGSLAMGSKEGKKSKKGRKGRKGKGYKGDL